MVDDSYEGNFANYADYDEGGEDAYLDQTWEDKYELGTTDDEWYGADGYDSDNYDTEDDE